MKISKMLLIVIVMVTSTISLHGRVRTALSERDFDRHIKKSHIMVVLLYDGAGGKEKNSVKNNNTLRLYESVSSKKFYDDADVVFVKVNVSIKESYSIAQRYGINQFPTCIVLEDGMPCLNSDKTVSMLFNFSSKDQIENLINRCYGHSIENAVMQKEQKKEARIKESQDESAPYFYPATVYSLSGDNSTWEKPTNRPMR